MNSVPPTNIINKSIREHLTDLIRGGHAHAKFEQAVEKLSPELATTSLNNLPYTIWELIEHIRIVQFDILDFCRNRDYKTPNWPDDYWPKSKSATIADLQNSIKQIHQDRVDFLSILNDDDSELYEALPNGDGQNLFREALLIADHTSYHTGQIILMRKILGDWEG